jgi:hypothetical protein
MIIVFEDENETKLSIHYEEDELYITIGGENEVDGRNNTIHIDDVERFINAIKFVTGKSV